MGFIDSYKRSFSPFWMIWIPSWMVFVRWIGFGFDGLSVIEVAGIGLFLALVLWGGRQTMLSELDKEGLLND